MIAGATGQFHRLIARTLTDQAARTHPGYAVARDQHTRGRHRVSVCDGTQSHVSKEHRGDRGHNDAGTKETFLRGDP